MTQNNKITKYSSRGPRYTAHLRRRVRLEGDLKWLDVTMIFYKKLKNVSCDYDQGWLKLNFCKLRRTVRHAHWACLCYVQLKYDACAMSNWNMLFVNYLVHIYGMLVDT